ncbi:MAG: hypothetical protein ACREPM_04570 [Gemmatimonadaceae bacterium]
MSADHTKPDEVASIEDLPVTTSKEDASTVKGGGIVPEVNANSLLSQQILDVNARGVGRAFGFRGA